jgi:transcriptional regulator with XRE-family HTH domain
MDSRELSRAKLPQRDSYRIWYQIRYHVPMNAAVELRRARTRAGLSLRQLARHAGTSHATLAAYEAGRTVPSVETFDRILRAAGVDAAVWLAPMVGGPDPADRGRELAEVLELAARFPARHSRRLRYPRFGAA